MALPALPALTVPFAPPAPQSPPQSPLAERSPRLVCQGDYDILISPTRGQADFVATNLKNSWKFANVIHQDEPSHIPNRRPLAPTTSICLYVRPDDDGQIVDVGRTPSMSFVANMYRSKWQSNVSTLMRSPAARTKRRLLQESRCKVKLI